MDNENGSSIVETTVALAILLVVASSLFLTTESILHSRLSRSAEFDFARLEAERTMIGMPICQPGGCGRAPRLMTTLDSLIGVSSIEVIISDSAQSHQLVSLNIYKPSSVYY